MLYLALGILGATVMPHNLYLHSGIVQTRAYGHSIPEKRQALKFSNMDPAVALDVCADRQCIDPDSGGGDVLQSWPHRCRRTRRSPYIAGATSRLFHRTDAVWHRAVMLRPQFHCDGNARRSDRHGGFLNIRLAPWLRRLITRALAIIPAALVTVWYGDSGTARLLIFSQVILSLQLPFAVFPLVLFTANKAKMGALVAPRWLIALASGFLAVAIAVLNIKLLCLILPLDRAFFERRWVRRPSPAHKPASSGDGRFA